MTETIAIVSQHRNEYYSRSKTNGNTRFRSFGSPPCRGRFRDFNFRNIKSSDGILPTPIKNFPEQSISPKTPSSSINKPKDSKKFTKSCSAPIPIKINTEFNEMFYSERWAGPTYSNSPPPSSLPIPKFSSRPKRTTSLELPSSSAPSFKFLSLAKSAPASPSREYDSPLSPDFRRSDESATKTLRRILNLDSADE